MKRFGLVLSLLFCILGPGNAQIPQNAINITYLGIKISNRSTSTGLSPIDIQLLESKFKTDLLEIARKEKYTLLFPSVTPELHQAISSGNSDYVRKTLESYQIDFSTNGFIWAEVVVLPDIIRFEVNLYDNPGFSLVMHKEVMDIDINGLLTGISVPAYDIFGLSPPTSITIPSLDGKTKAGPSIGTYLRDKEIKISDIAGVWQGDYDLSRVIVTGDGTARAYFNEKDYLKLKISIQSQTIRFIQDEPNSPKLYLNAFPSYSVASQIVRLARPMSWEFMLSVERDRLIGKKNTSFFYIEQGTVVQVDNTFSREAEWVKIQ